MSGILDPKTFGTSPETALAERLAALERRVAALESTPAVAFGNGAPTADLPDGWLYLDRSNNRLYARVNATWRYAALT